MYFYIDNGIVTTSDVEIPSLKNNELDEQQIAFYLANRTASVQEVLNKALTVHVPSLDELKAEKLNELNIHFGTIFANGYEDEITGWKLFCGFENVIDYAILLLSLAKKSNDYETKIGTYTGWHLATKETIDGLLERYSVYMLPYTTTYRELKTNIETATTKQILDSITW